MTNIRLFSASALNPIFKFITVSLILILLQSAVTRVDAAPPSGGLTPIVDSVVYDKADSYTAFFSYQNDSDRVINIPVGDKNTFGADIPNRGQPIRFTRGLQQKVFSVALLCATTISWTVTGSDSKISTAIANAPLCTSGAALEKPKTGDSVPASCSNPNGWFEDEQKREEYNRTYYVARIQGVESNKTPTTNPELFKTVVCAYGAKVNYKDETTGKILPVTNLISELSAKNKIKTGYFYETSGNDFKAYFAKNPNDGWQFTSKTGDKVIVKTVTVGDKPLSFDPKKPAKIDKSTITYLDVLPNVDLSYTATYDGITKLFVLKNADALKNDLSSIVFTYDLGANALMKKNAIKDEISDKVAVNAGKTNTQTVKEKLKKVQKFETKKPGISLAIPLQNPTWLTSSSSSSVVSAVSSAFSSVVSSVASSISSSSSSSQSSLPAEKPLLVPDIVDSENSLTRTDLAKETNALSQISAEFDIKNVQNAAKTDLEKSLITEKKVVVDAQKTELEALTKKIETGTAGDEKTVLQTIQKIEEKSHPADSIETKTPGLLLSVPNSFSSKSRKGINETFVVSADGKTLTILPDVAAIKAVNEFPYFIDPVTYQNGNGSKDTWVAQRDGWSARGANNTKHLAIGSNPALWTTDGWTRTYNSYGLLSFQLPAGVAPGNVANAQLRLLQYDMNYSSPGCGWYCFVPMSGRIATYVDAANNNDFDENGVTWNNQGRFVDYVGDIGFVNVTDGAISHIWSNNISNGINWKGQNGRVTLGIYDQTFWDNYAARNTGAIVCAREQVAAPCQGDDRMPLLQIDYNNPPSPPIAWQTSGDMAAWNCDKSAATPTGACGRTANSVFTNSNINDGDANIDANCSIHVITSDMNFTKWNNQNDWTWYPNQQTGCGWRSYTANVPNGTYKWMSRNKDERDAYSFWSNLKTTVIDTSPPVRTEFKQLPEFSNGQINMQLPSFGDNLADKYIIEYPTPFGENYSLRYLGGAVLPSGVSEKAAIISGLPVATVASNIAGQRTQLLPNTDSFLQQWNLTWQAGNKLILASDSTKCLQKNADNSVTIETCVSGQANQVLTIIFSQNQLKFGTGECLQVQQNAQNQALLGAGICNLKNPAQAFVLQLRSALTTGIDTDGGNGTLASFGTLNPIGWGQAVVLESNGQIRNYAGGRCLTADNARRLRWSVCTDDALSRPDGAINGAAWQRWKIMENGRIQQINDAYCLDINWGRPDQGLYWNDCNAGTSQQFVVRKQELAQWPINQLQTGANQLQIGKPFLIRYAQNPSKGYDFDGRFTGAATLSRIYDYTGNSNQTFIYTVDQELKLAASPDLCITAVTVGQVPQRNACNGSPEQKWIFTLKNQLQRANTNQCLDLLNWIENNGNSVNLANCTDASAQKWYLDYATSSAPQISTQFTIRYQRNQTMMLDAGYSFDGYPNNSLATENGGVNIYATNDSMGPVNGNKLFVYTAAKEIKMANDLSKCLTGVGQGITTARLTCNSSLAQKWEFLPSGQIRNIGIDKCLFADVQGNETEWNGYRVWTGGCLGRGNGDPNNYETQYFHREQFILDFGNLNAPAALQTPEMGGSKVVYDVQVSKNGGAKCSTGWSQNPQFVLPNATNCGVVTLADGDTIVGEVRAADRLITDTNWYKNGANVSERYALGTTKIDTQKPEIVANSLKITPSDSSLRADDRRISPSNPTSAGQKDGVIIKYSWKDTNPFAAKVRIFQVDAADSTKKTEVAYLQSCSVGGDAVSNCSKYSHTFASNTATETTFTWDGKDKGGNYVADGKYEVVPVVMDMTCRSDTKTDFSFIDYNYCNSTEGIPGEDRFFTVDNSGAAIGISSPVSGSWVNNPIFEIKGAVAGYNKAGLEDRDAYKLFGCQQKPGVVCGTANGDYTNFTEMAFDTLKNFVFKPLLTIGQNTFAFKSVDLAYNKQSSNFALNYENNPPVINSISVAANNSGGAGIYTASVVLQDSNPTANLAHVSSFWTGTNQPGLDISLLTRTAPTKPWTEVPLYKDGVNLTESSQSNPNLLEKVNCAFVSGFAADNPVRCDITMRKIQIDGDYQLFVRVRDRAGNQVCNIDDVAVREIRCANAPLISKPAAFVVDTKTYLTAPIVSTNPRLSRIDLTVGGKVERNTTLSILNPSTNSTLNFTIQNTGIQTLAPLTLTVLCAGEQIDDDQNPLTSAIEVCDYSTKLTLTQNPVAGTPLANPLQLTVVDAAQNSISRTGTALVDTANITLVSTPSTSLISPNGDGNADTIAFSNTLADAANVPIGLIKSWTTTLKKTSDSSIVWTQTGVLTLPNRIDFDGKANTGVDSGKYLVDAGYTYALSVTRTIGGLDVVTTTSGTNIIAKSNVLSSENPTITAPLENFTTTRGVINVQGQAPKSTADNVWSVTICAHKISGNNVLDSGYLQSDPTKIAASWCTDTNDVSVTSRTDTFGFYSGLVTFATTDSSKYAIYTRSFDKNGVKSGTSAARNVQLDLLSAFRSVEIIPSLDGINSAADIAALTAAAPTKTIDQLKTIQIKTMVSQNVEALDLDFGAYDNMIAPGSPNYWDITIPGRNHIATINSIVEPRIAYNTQSDPTIKRDITAKYTGSGADITANSYSDLRARSDTAILGYQTTYLNATGTPIFPLTMSNARKGACAAAECLWTINYPYPAWMTGGTFEVRLRAYKGDKVEEITRAIAINGQIKMAPRVLRLDKQNLTTDCLSKILNSQICDTTLAASYAGLETAEEVYTKTTTNELATNFYTNTPRFKLWVGAEADATIPLRIRSGSGVISTYPIVLKTTINGILKVASNNSDFSLDLTPYRTIGIKTETFELDFGSLSQPFSSTITTKITLDQEAPAVIAVQTNVAAPYTEFCSYTTSAGCSIDQKNYTNSSAVNPWIRSSANVVAFSTTATEALRDSFISNEFGTRGFAIKPLSSQCRELNQLSLKDNVIPRENVTNSLFNPSLAESVANPRTIPVSPELFAVCLTEYQSSPQSLATLSFAAPTKQTEGLRAPSIYLEDLAGNKSVTSNSATALDSTLTAIFDNNDKLKIANTLSRQIIDTSFILNSDGSPNATNFAPNPMFDPANPESTTNAKVTATALNTTQLAIKNGMGVIGDPLPQNYPYSTSFIARSGQTIQKSARGLSRDFTLFADTTLPEKGEFDLTSLGQSQVIKAQLLTQLNANAVTQTQLNTSLNANSIADAFSADTVFPEDSRINRVGRINTTLAICTQPQKDIITTYWNDIATKTRTYTSFTRSELPACNLQNTDGSANISLQNPAYLPVFVTRGNTISFIGQSEQYAQISLQLTTRSNGIDTILPPQLPQVSGQSCITPANRTAAIANGSTQSAYTASYTPVIAQAASGDAKSIKSSMIVKSATQCSFIFTYTFGDDGSQDASNTAKNYVEARFVVSDLAGNLPPVLSGTNQQSTNGSQSVLVYHDTTAPAAPIPFTLASKLDVSGNEIGIVTGDQLITTDSFTRAITNQPELSTTLTGEAFGDVSVRQFFTNTLNTQTNAPLAITNSIVTRDTATNLIATQNQRITTLDATGKTMPQLITLQQTPLTITQPRDDQRVAGDNCIQTTDLPTAGSSTGIKNRRVGTCNDGYYTLTSQVADSAGNHSPVSTTIGVERDTVAPNPATTLTLSKSGNRLGETLNLNFTAEAYAKAQITITNNQGYANTIYRDIPATGVITLNNVANKLTCGNKQYVASVKVMDRAGNVSDSVISNTITTDECPRCTTSGNGELSLPFTTNYSINGYFGQYEDQDSSGVGHNGPRHGGIDYGLSAGTSVLAAEDGIVEYAYYGFTDNYGKTWGSVEIEAAKNRNGGLANYVALRNPQNGRITIYGHLSNSSASVTQGQTITRGTKIGEVGSTGYSTGFHLHFQVQTASTEFKLLAGQRVSVRDDLVYTYPDNPFKYLPLTNTNLTALQEQQTCAKYNGYGAAEFNPQRDGDKNALATITEDEARGIIAQYIINNTGISTEILGAVDQLNPSSTITNDNWNFKKYLWGNNQSNIAYIKPRLNISKQYEGFYSQFVGKVTNLANQTIAYQGIIVVNPYQKKAYLVKNAVYDKYFDKAGSVNVSVLQYIGVPNMEEDLSSIWNYKTDNLGSVDGIYTGNAWYQKFSIGTMASDTTQPYYNNSVIDFHKRDDLFKGLISQSNYIPRDIGDIYLNTGGSSGQYRFPQSNPVDDDFNTKNCAQMFDGRFTPDKIDTCPWAQYDGKNIEQLLSVDGSSWISSQENQFIAKGTNPNFRPIKLNAIKGGDNPNLNDSAKQIYITLHGWNNLMDDMSATDATDLNNTYMRTLAQTIPASVFDTVIDVDWGQASSYKLLGNDCPVCVEGAAKWIVPTAEKIADRLYQYGLRDMSKVHFIGHSLGTILSAEIANALNTKQYVVNKATLIALEPPNTKAFAWNSNGINIDGNRGKYPILDTDYYRSKFSWSRAFMGTASSANDNGLANTAHEQIFIDYSNQWLGLSNMMNEHGWTVKTMVQLMGFNAPVNTELSKVIPTNQGLQNYARNVTGVITSPGSNEGSMAYYENISPNGFVRSGTSTSNTINAAIKSRLGFSAFDKTLKLIGGSGADVFATDARSDNITQISDFSTNEGDTILITTFDTCQADQNTPRIYCAKIGSNTNQMDLTIQTNNGQPMSAGYIKAKWDAFKNAAFNDKDEAQKATNPSLNFPNGDRIVIFK